MREYCGGYARMTVGQNIVLRWVRDESLFEVFQGLRDLGLADIGAQGIADVVSCPGTDSCKLGITASMGLNQAIQARVELMDVTDALTRKIHIKMSGCPNSCGQHHIANIGFHGAAMKVGPQQLPAYHMFVGGSYDNGNLRMATQLKVRLPAKRGPDAVERVVQFYEAGRQPGEEFNAFFDRVGAEAFETAIEDLTLPGDFTDANRHPHANRDGNRDPDDDPHADTWPPAPPPGGMAHGADAHAAGADAGVADGAEWIQRPARHDAG